MSKLNEYKEAAANYAHSTEASESLRNYVSEIAHLRSLNMSKADFDFCETEINKAVEAIEKLELAYFTAAQNLAAKLCGKK